MSINVVGILGSPCAEEPIMNGDPGDAGGCLR